MNDSRDKYLHSVLGYFDYLEVGILCDALHLCRNLQSSSASFLFSSIWSCGIHCQHHNGLHYRCAMYKEKSKWDGWTMAVLIARRSTSCHCCISKPQSLSSKNYCTPLLHGTSLTSTRNTMVCLGFTSTIMLCRDFWDIQLRVWAFLQ